MSYRYELTVKLYDTDAAGVLFFGHQFRLAHDAYQTYLESCGLSFAAVLDGGKMLIPLVHAEADYLKPVKVGDKLSIELTAEKISTHSFVLKYVLMRPEGEEVGTARTVHVTIDRATQTKIALPVELREALKKIAG